MLLEIVTYAYTDANWKDKLTEFNGTYITYDEIGNPTSDGEWLYAWEKGRQLKAMSKASETVVFEYNASGLRVKKTATSTGTTHYTLHGKQITHLTNGTNTLHFFYDASGKPAIVEWNNGTTTQKYAYIHNLQGDIIALIDDTGAKVVSYTYDAWGKPLSTTGSLANTLGKLNPFRYRGYVYDEETGLYYLRSRYYNSHWMRFINADVFVGDIGRLTHRNQFVYCSNRPVSFHDKNGYYEFSAEDFAFDCQGIQILYHYLFGNGEDFIVEDDRGWSEYMRNAPICASDCGYPMNTTLSSYTHQLLKPYSTTIEDGESITVDITLAMSLQNGESIIGYNYLHGSNKNVGGYHVNAIITRKNGCVTYSVVCKWNDMIDPNYQYSSDAGKAAFAKKIPFANPMDYRICISWSDTFVDGDCGANRR